MSRPSFGFNQINHGLEGWDAEVDGNFTTIDDFFLTNPTALPEHTGDQTDLASTFAPGSYDRCMIWVNHTTHGWILYYSNGTTWYPLAPAMNHVVVTDEKTAGTAGGGFTSGAWQTRDLNTEVADDFGLASLASNQVTLQAGLWRYQISAPAFAVDEHKVKLRNVTDGADVRIGTSEYAPAGTQTRAFVSGAFTISAAKAFSVQHRCTTTKATDGYGRAAGFSAVETYTVAEFRRLRQVNGV